MNDLYLRRSFAVFAIVFAFTAPSCTTNIAIAEQNVFDRIEYVYDLKQHVVEKHWPGIGNTSFDIPLVYYTDSVCYAANPTEKFLAAQTARPAVPLFENDKVKIYKTALIDTMQFHMSVGMSLGNPVPDYDYRSPFMLCSSFEITRATIPGVESIEEWATMVMHEYFHGFQFRHHEFLEHYEKIVLNFPSQDTLRCLYKNNDLFASGIDSENEALLAALASTDRNETTAQIETFFRLRDARRRQVVQQSGFDPAPLERLYETMEGTARYVESALKSELEEVDPGIEMPEWLYRSDKTTWFYASGFNMARLLDTLQIEYRSRLFNEGALSLEQILYMEYDD